MKRIAAVFLTLWGIILASCRGPLPEKPTATLTLTPPAQGNSTPTESFAGATIASPVALTSPPPPKPSLTPAQESVEPQEGPQASYIPAVIHLFHVTPFQGIKPGDEVLVVWEFEGSNGRICAVSEAGPTDCFEVTNRGEEKLAVQNVSKPYWLALYINVTTFPDAEQLETANLYVGCEHLWFFDQPEAAVCPAAAPLVGPVAAQSFERGGMLWVSGAGRYYGLQDVSAGHGNLLRADDPLAIVADTESEVSPPAGYFAPTSGFGLVWRGDAEVYPDWGEALGWGLSPETSYIGTFQCDSEAPRYQFCYLTQPDHWLAALHPLGSWYAKSVTFLNN